jgi:putative ABC transport system permease protein
MSTTFQDVRYAMRTFRRRPGFTATALVTLALGIGANTAIFSVFHAVLLRDLPFADADQIVRMYGTHRRYNYDHGVVSPFDYDVWEKRTRTLARVAAVRSVGATLTGAGDPMSVSITAATPSFFDVMATAPALGRVFTTAETGAGAAVVVLSGTLWANRFGRDAAIVGRTIALNDQPWTVIGVMPLGFAYPEGVDLWQPLHLSPALRGEKGAWFLGGIGRMRPEATIDAVGREFDALAAELEATYPKERGERGFNVIGIHEDLGLRVAGGLQVLQGMVALVLLIGCANVANLLLASAAGRGREFAVRSSLGASRARLFQQSMTESLVLSAAGSVLGAVAAVWGVRALVAMAPDRLLPYPDTIGVRGAALAFTAAVAVLTAILFGLAPAMLSAWRRAAGDLASGVRIVGGGLGWSRRHWLRGSLVAAEVALALVLLSGAGLLVRSYLLVLSQAPGFTTEGLLTARLTLPSTRYGTPESRALFWTNVTRELESLPGVTSVAAGSAVPFALWEFLADFTIRSREHVPNDGSGIRVVTPSYFETLGIPILRGRGFTADDAHGSDPVVLVTDAFANEHLPGLDPIGQLISWKGPNPRWHTIVGVVGSTRHRSLEEPLRAEVYQVIPASAPPAGLHVALRTSGTPRQWERPLREAVARVDPALPVLEVATMDDLIDGRLARRRFTMTLVTVFAGLAGVLAATGIYGVISFVVTGARREVGIRLALGARQAQVMRLVIRQGLSVVLLGAALGLTASWWLVRILEGQLFRIAPTDPVTLATVFLGLLAVAALACWVPAARAGRVPAAEVLRSE